MKRIILTAVDFCIVSFVMFGCSIAPDIPIGYVKKEEFYDKNGFRDYTDYCKYYYNDKKAFENHSRYRQISESDIDTISGYFSDFQSWMEEEKRTAEYDFDINCISEGDYALIETEEGSQIGNGKSVYGKYDIYTVYFFDTDSCILYYIHEKN